MPPLHDDEPQYRTTIDRVLLRRLFDLTKPHARILIGSVILLVLVSVVELSFPLLMKIGIDRYIKGHDVPGLVRLSGGYVALLVIVFFLRYAQMVLTQELGQRIMFDLRTHLFRHVHESGVE